MSFLICCLLLHQTLSQHIFHYKSNVKSEKCETGSLVPNATLKLVVYPLKLFAVPVCKALTFLIGFDSM